MAPRTTLLLAGLASLASFGCISASSTELGTQINIHVPLIPSASSAVTLANQVLTSLLPTPSNQKIDFVNLFVPHCTLYLTTFRNESILDGTISRLAQEAVSAASSNCASSTSSNIMTVGTSLTLSGSYAMLEVPTTSCLQSLSDSLVIALSPYVTEYAKKAVPSWIYDLPPDQQAAKIALVHQYGSPNVFAGFAPHVTLAFDSVEEDSAAYAAATEEVGGEWSEVYNDVETVAFGFVGLAGTVKQGPSVLQSIEVGAADSALASA